MRAKVAVSLLTAALAVGSLTVPGVALAQGGASNPFAPGLPVPNGQAPNTSGPAPIIAPTTTSSSASGSGLSGSAAVIIAIGAIVVLGGISFFIWRDARRRAPVRHAHATAGVGTRSGSKRPIKPRKLSPAERRRRRRGRAR